MAFAYKGTLTVTSNSALLPSTQTDYPLLVSVTDNVLKSTGNGGQVTDAQGDDIVFCSDGALTTFLDYEIESWDAATGALMAWVKIPSLALGTVFYMGIGDSGITTFQGGPSTDVWPAGYGPVYHLGNGTTLSAADSKGSYNGTVVGATAGAGKVGGAANFDGVDDAITLTGPAIDFATDDFTVSFWIRPEASSDTYASVLTGNGGGVGFFFKEDTDKISFYLAGDHLNDTALTIGAWQHVVIRATNNAGTTDLELFLNGVADGTGAETSIVVWTPAAIGDDGGQNLKGLLDEMRVYLGLLSDDWLTIDYESQNDNATFVSKAFESLGGSIIPLLHQHRRQMEIA